MIGETLKNNSTLTKLELERNEISEKESFIQIFKKSFPLLLKQNLGELYLAKSQETN